MNDILKEDIRNICENTNIDWEKYYNSSFLITGATGLIGSLIVRTLLYLNENNNANIKLYLEVLNKNHGLSLFKEQKQIEYIEAPVENIPEIEGDIDYVIHLASPTSSRFFVEHPVETLDTIVGGTRRILEICKSKHIKKMLYFSSMEMYGVLSSDNVKESDLGYINNLNERSSYSEGKRMAELYCYSYFKQYDIPVTIIRLAMCFGSGIARNENRVYKVFIDQALDGKDIEVKSTGKTILNFIYTFDALKGIFTLLSRGNNGEAYNIGSDPTNYTIMDMANFVAKYCNVNVVQNIPQGNAGFAPENHMVLNNAKLKTLGWEPDYNVEKALERTIEYLKIEKESTESFDKY